MIAIIVAAGIMLVVGCTVWMQDIGSPYNHSYGSFKTVDGDLTSEYGGTVGDDCWPTNKPCAWFACHYCCHGSDLKKGHSLGHCY